MISACRKISFFLTAVILLSIQCLAQEYKVAAGDVIRIEVYDNQDLNTIVQISEQGTIVMPLLGDIKIINLSTDQISKKIAELLADGYLVNPQVNVFINEYRGQEVLILGQVQNPGTFKLQGPTNFLEVLSKAGGLTENAADAAVVKRKNPKQNENNPLIIIIDLKQLIEKGNTSENIDIIDGDSINIGRAGQYYVTGEVRNSSSFRYDKDNFPNVIKAITLAGGFTENANQDGIIIYREENGEKKTIQPVQLDTLIKVHDVIMVPSVFIQGFQGKKANILGQINNPGYFELRGPTTLLEFISKAGGLTPAAGDVVTIKRLNPLDKNHKTKVITIDLNALIELGDLSQNIEILQGDSVYINRLGHYYVNGQVSRPDAYEYRKGDGITIVKAITLAGGFTGSADEDGIKIVRIIDGKEKVLENVKMSEPVLENDVIIVPESFF